MPTVKIEKTELCYSKCKFSKATLIRYQMPDTVKLVVVGESPGYEEELQGKPFVGKCGKLLDNTLYVSRLDRKETYITNVIKCFPGAGKNKQKILDPEVMRCYKQFLIAELEATAPAPVIVLGSAATKAVSTYIFGKKKTLKELRGKVVEHKGRYFCFENHPSWYLRNYGFDGALSRFSKNISKLISQAFNKQDDLTTTPKKLPFSVESNPDKALSFLESLSDNSLLVLDIETNGKPFVMEDAKVTCIGFCLVDSPDTTYVVSDKLPEVVKALERHRIIAHNGKFDVNFIRKKYSSQLYLYFDTLLVAYANDQNRREYSLESLVFAYTPHAALWRNDTKSGKKAAILNGDILLEYNAIDVYATHELYKYYQNKIADDNFLFWEILMPASRFYQDTEISGAYIDISRLEYISNLCQELVNSILSEINNIPAVKQFVKEKDTEYNPNSPQHNITILRDYLKIEVENRRTGQKELISSSSKNVLQYVEHKFAKLLTKYRAVAKLKSTYADGLIKRAIKEGKYYRGYPSIFLHKTVTGRTSSSGLASDSASPIKRAKDDISFNIQNLPRGYLLRGAVIAPENFTIVSFDYKTLEIMIAAAYSQEPVWLEFILSGGDFHSLMASILFQKKPEDVVKDERQMAKTISFGLLYGAGPGLLVERFGISWERAQEIYDSYFAKVPVLKSCIQQVIRFIEKHLYIETPFGRRRTFTKDDLDKNSHKREGFNTIIQATASDINLLACREIRRQAIAEGWWLDKILPLATVHDSSSFYVVDDKNFIKKAVEMFSECAILRILKYEPVKKLLKNVPLCIDFKIGKRWC